MKKLMIALTLGMSLSISVLAEDMGKAADQAESTIEKSTSRNPFTKTTTQTTIKKEKRNIKNTDNEGVKVENTYKTQEKKSDDGKKTSITTEETYTREQQ